MVRRNRVHALNSVSCVAPVRAVDLVLVVVLLRLGLIVNLNLVLRMSLREIIEIRISIARLCMF